MRVRESRSSSSIRIHVHLRGADVALLDSMGPAEVWYFLPHVDLPPADQLPASCVRVTPISAIRRVFTTRADTIEIPEPLWARFLPMALTLMIAARVARMTTGTPRWSVFYALENNTPDQALFGRSRVPRLVRKAFVAVLGWVVSPMIDRVAFGSPSARRAYESMRTLKIPEALVLTELPARPDEPTGVHRAAHHALFVGGLELRKGIEPLLRSWETVETSLPDATLTIIGSGPLEPTVRRWAEVDPVRRTALGQVSHDDLDNHYKNADVLIAPSIRDGRWREQIGLQLREALSAGLTIVASDETGLADWLAQHGHHVLATDRLAQLLPSKIQAALENPLDRPSVRASLPPLDQRVHADLWLHRQGTGRSS